MKKIQETFNKDPEELKNKQTMRNNTINEIPIFLEGIDSRITEEHSQTRSMRHHHPDTKTRQRY